MRKIYLSLALSSAIFAGSFEYGHGNFETKFDFFGLSSTLSTDISTYSLIEQHKNILQSKYYYRYNVTWMDLDAFENAKTTINRFVPSSFTVPIFKYEPKGLDLDIGIGRDFWKKGQRDYFGIGLDIGLSIPTIDVSQQSSGSFNLNRFNIDIKTYKIGPSIAFSKSFNRYMSIYTSANYCYQTFQFKSDKFQSDIDVDGNSYRFDIGMRLDFIHKNYKIKFITLSPRLYATIGYRYQKWNVDDFNVKVVNFSTIMPFSNMSFQSNYGYFGIGYSF